MEAMTNPYRDQGPVKEFTYDMPRKLTFNQLASYGVYREKLRVLCDRVLRSTHNGWKKDVEECIADLEETKSEACKRVKIGCDHVSFVGKEAEHTCTDCERIVRTIKGLTFDDINRMLSPGQPERSPVTACPPTKPTRSLPPSRAEGLIIALMIITATLVTFYVTRHL